MQRKATETIANSKQYAFTIGPCDLDSKWRFLRNKGVYPIKTSQKEKWKWEQEEKTEKGSKKKSSQKGNQEKGGQEKSSQEGNQEKGNDSNVTMSATIVGK